MYIFIAIVLACIVSGIVVGSMWSALKSVASQSRADSYVQNNSLKLQVRTDTFLYSRTEKRPRPKQNPQS